VYNGELIAGGEFTTAGGVTANRIARWNGTTWQALGTGMSGGYYPYVLALAVYNGELIAGGGFTITTAGGQVSAYWARWGCADGGPPALGDLNCDGTYGQGSFGDINPFVLYLSNFAAWEAEFPGCNPLNGDINGDGLYPDFGDINPFVALLTGSR
jgi:hypothetical protein